MALEKTNVIDLIAHDAATDEVVLAMFEPRPWSGGDEQLFQLQEKLNAYLSFALDGEMAGAYPQFVGKKLRIELRCAHEPDSRASEMIAAVQRQIAFQEIKFTVAWTNEAQPGCGSSCACRSK